LDFSASIQAVPFSMLGQMGVFHQAPHHSFVEELTQGFTVARVMKSRVRSSCGELQNLRG
jgi:hypothetical protein